MTGPRVAGGVPAKNCTIVYLKLSLPEGLELGSTSRGERKRRSYETLVAASMRVGATGRNVEVPTVKHWLAKALLHNNKRLLKQSMSAE